MKINVEMPSVSRCVIQQCAYNKDNHCRARAITVGDGHNPNCDSYFSTTQHTIEAKRIAGVGACKVASCQFNDDFECAADSIKVGVSLENKISCLTFKQKATRLSRK